MAISKILPKHAQFGPSLEIAHPNFRREVVPEINPNTASDATFPKRMLGMEHLFAKSRKTVSTTTAPVLDKDIIVALNKGSKGITLNSFQEAVALLGENNHENRQRVATVLASLPGRIAIEGAIINEVMGAPKTRRIQFLQNQAETIQRNFNCTELALHLIGNRKPSIFYERPLAGLWANESQLVLVDPQSECHRYLRALRNADEKGDGFFPQNREGYRFEIRRENKKETVGSVNRRLPSWETMTEILDKEEIVSVLSYHARPDGMADLDTFHHTTLCTNQGRYFFIDTTHITHPRVLELKAENYQTIVNCHEGGSYLMAVGGHDLPPVREPLTPTV